MKTGNKKYLIYAFIASLWMGLGGLILYTNVWYGLGIVSLIEAVIFPILGYKTLKGNTKASGALLSLFVIDRIVYLVKWVPRQPSLQITNILIVGIFLFLELWCFHNAYKVLTNGKNQ